MEKSTSSPDSMSSDMTTSLVVTRWHTGSISAGIFGSLGQDSQYYSVSTWTFTNLNHFLAELPKSDLGASSMEWLHPCLSALQSFEQRNIGGVVVCPVSRSECRRIRNQFLSSKVESPISLTWEEPISLFAMSSPEKSASELDELQTSSLSDGLALPTKLIRSRESLTSFDPDFGPSLSILELSNNTLTLNIPLSNLSESGLESLLSATKSVFLSLKRSTDLSDESADATKSG